MKALIPIFILTFLCVFANADNYVVLAAGSMDFWNYRHQADVYHAYQIFRKNGIPAENILTFSYDDVVTDKLNPVIGSMYNKPSKGPGVDVYEGVMIDYIGEDVNPQNFLNALKGDFEKTDGKKVLASTSEDNVFIYFVDHGAYGLLCFPEDELYADEFIETLLYMHRHKKYKKMVIYVEACESGSMFEGLLPDDLNIYVTTSADPYESSWATYCNPNNTVNGVSLKTCLGDQYSISFLENLESVDPFEETLETQYQVMKKGTTKSSVQQYGQLTFLDSAIGVFEAYGAPEKKDVTEKVFPNLPKIDTVDSRDIKLHFMLNRFGSEPNSQNKKNLEKEINSVVRHNKIFHELKDKLQLNVNDLPGKIDFDCLRARMQIYKQTCGRLSEYGLKFVRYIYYTCAQGVEVQDYELILQKQCSVQKEFI